jgi:hypothetical protein
MRKYALRVCFVFATLAPQVPFAETDVTVQPASLYAATKVSVRMLQCTHTHIIS